MLWHNCPYKAHSTNVLRQRQSKLATEPNDYDIVNTHKTILACIIMIEPQEFQTLHLHSCGDSWLLLLLEDSIPKHPL